MKVLRLPPVLPALFALLAVVVHIALWRVPVLPAGIVQYVAGAVVLLAAAALAVWAQRSFRRHGEELAVHVRTRRIVMDGAYEWGRNPVYLSFVLATVGLGLLLNGWVIVGAAIPTFAWLNWYVIPREESKLRESLGAEYGVYARRTRRWV